jgi:hypothetical protein
MKGFVEAVQKERIIFEEQHAALVFATLEKSAELARAYAARVEECARAFAENSGSGIHDAIELLKNHLAPKQAQPLPANDHLTPKQAQPLPAKDKEEEEEEEDSSSSFSSLDSACSESHQEEEEEEDFVVDDDKEVKVYDAAFFDKWATNKFTENIQGKKKRNRKRPRAYSPSKHRNDPMGMIESLSDEPVDKHDLIGLKDFLNSIYQDGIMGTTSTWGCKRYVYPLQEIRSNLGTAKTNEKASETFNALLRLDGPSATVEHKRVPGNGKKYCALCGMLKYCNATLWVANDPSDENALIQCPIGAHCAVLAERLIQFQQSVLDHKTATVSAFREIEKAFEGVMDAHEGKRRIC